MSDFEQLFNRFCSAQASFESSRHIYRREHEPGQVRRLLGTLAGRVERGVGRRVHSPALVQCGIVILRFLVFFRDWSGHLIFLLAYQIGRL